MIGYLQHNDVTFHIRASFAGNQVIYEVWRHNHTHGIECLLAEADTRPEARELLKHYADLEKDFAARSKEMRDAKTK